MTFLMVKPACRTASPGDPPPTPRRKTRRWGLLLWLFGGVSSAGAPVAQAGQLTVELATSRKVTLVGAVDRWDAEGNPRREADPKAKIQSPAVTAAATPQPGNRWVFDNLAPGRYDLVILADERVRVEGFHYGPVLEFDPVVPHTAKPPEAARQWVLSDAAASRRYENQVAPLHLAGDDRQIRLLVQLLRDEPTSWDAQFGEPVASIRHEIWQYSYRYGGWAKEKKTKLLDRILMAKRELRLWTWIWTPELGGVEVADEPVAVFYRLPQTWDAQSARGLLPY